MIFSKPQRASLLALALTFSICPPRVLAQTKNRRAETSKDIIEKAYNLSLQKDRSQAINILVNAIKQENLNGGSTTELKKSLQQVSYLFYSDRAQQAYELALSLRKTDLAGAQQKLNEALRMEPDNLSLVVELQRILLVKGDCSAAGDGISKERLQDPFDENLVLLLAQSQACLGKWDAFAKTKELADTRKSALTKYWVNLEIEQAFSDKNVARAKELLALLVKTDAKYPAVSYWQWRIAAPGAKAEAAQKYLKDCKNISPMTYRQYMTDVNLCRNKITPENAE